ncbi:hypothetical protein PYJP_20420 [Pyrofollis japonicus]|uniref:hypothetical protein n=1 Tax=Pyrofollis japonicus TaxID=3060460 RepID=UPI00295ACA77|nr:hypothetical protein [Pyrofollis japonicus]BEP18690.1 hypothetical protein PYJP_20420 [Pyrofollis japonicus]
MAAWLARHTLLLVTMVAAAAVAAATAAEANTHLGDKEVLVAINTEVFSMSPRILEISTSTYCGNTTLAIYSANNVPTLIVAVFPQGYLEEALKCLRSVLLELGQDPSKWYASVMKSTKIVHVQALVSKTITEMESSLETVPTTTTTTALVKSTTTRAEPSYLTRPTTTVAKPYTVVKTMDKNKAQEKGTGINEQAATPIIQTPASTRAGPSTEARLGAVLGSGLIAALLVYTVWRMRSA